MSENHIIDDECVSNDKSTSSSNTSSTQSTKFSPALFDFFENLKPSDRFYQHAELTESIVEQILSDAFQKHLIEQMEEDIEQTLSFLSKKKNLQMKSRNYSFYTGFAGLSFLFYCANKKGK